MRRLRIAWFTPHPEKAPESTSAYVTALLAPVLSEVFDLHLFTDSFQPYQQYPTYHYLKAFKCHQEQPYDLFFYQLEDRPCSDFIRFHLGLFPGVVWFHDIFLSTAGPVPILNSPWSDTIDILHNGDVAWPDRLKEHTYCGPLAHREMGLALAPIFSSEVAHTEYHRQITHRVTSEKGDSYFLPVPVSDRSFQALHPKEDESFRIGMACAPRIENRAEKILQALAAIDSGAFELVWLVPKGDAEYAQTLLSDYPDMNVRLESDLCPGRWYEQLETLDAALHLHFSVYNHLEPYLGMSLAAGLPVAVTDFGVHEFLPSDIVYKIEPGDTEFSEMKHLMQALLKEKRSNGKRLRLPQASSFAKERYDLTSTAEQLQEVFTHLATTTEGSFAQAQKQWKAFQKRAYNDVLLESEQLMDQGALQTFLDPVYQELGWTKHTLI